MNTIQKNIGILNALIRITCGLTMLSYVTAKMVRRPWASSSYLFWAVMAAMKVAEGITQYCPITALFSMRNKLFDSFDLDILYDDSPINNEASSAHTASAEPSSQKDL
ncbi:MAG: DUF2892 domain-containing protein [Bacillus sp. (in: firmicutes)]